MTIDKVGWAVRPRPVQNDGQRRQEQKRRPPKKQPRQDSDRRPGSIDELA